MIKNSTEEFEFPENTLPKKYSDFIFENTSDVIKNFPESTGTKQNISLLTKEFLLTQEKTIYQNLINFMQSII